MNELITSKDANATVGMDQKIYKMLAGYNHTLKGVIALFIINFFLVVALSALIF